MKGRKYIVYLPVIAKVVADFVDYAFAKKPNLAMKDIIHGCVFVLEIHESVQNFENIEHIRILKAFQKSCFYTPTVM